MTRMPVLFIGHGNPMHAIRDNAFTRQLSEWAEKLPRPRAILCVSAHWVTRGTRVTGMARPRTIHDFGGFPKELFAVEYPAPGSPELAKFISETFGNGLVQIDASSWGLDHGTWAVLRHMYPKADIPVVQFSLNGELSGSEHLALAHGLRALRDQEILIVGSGNVVHNLGLMDSEAAAPAYPWADDFDRWVRDRLLAHDAQSLADDYESSEAGTLSVPTPEHYWPLIYSVGASLPEDRVTFPFEGFEHRSLSMRCVQFGI